MRNTALAPRRSSAPPWLQEETDGGINIARETRVVRYLRTWMLQKRSTHHGLPWLASCGPSCWGPRVGKFCLETLLHACASRGNNVRCLPRVRYLSLAFPGIANAWTPIALEKLPLPSSLNRWIVFFLHVRPRGTRLLQSMRSNGGVLNSLLLLLARRIKYLDPGGRLRECFCLRCMLFFIGPRRHDARNKSTRTPLRVHATLLRSFVIFLTSLFSEAPKGPRITNPLHRVCEPRCALARKGCTCEANA